MTWQPLPDRVTPHGAAVHVAPTLSLPHTHTHPASLAQDVSTWLLDTTTYSVAGFLETCSLGRTKMSNSSASNLIFPITDHDYCTDPPPGAFRDNCATNQGTLALWALNYIVQGPQAPRDISKQVERQALLVAV